MSTSAKRVGARRFAASAIMGFASEMAIPGSSAFTASRTAGMIDAGSPLVRNDQPLEPPNPNWPSVKYIVSRPASASVKCRWCFTTPMTSTNSAVSARNRTSRRFPTACSPGNARAATSSSMITDCDFGSFSASVKSRPAMIGVRIISK